MNVLDKIIASKKQEVAQVKQAVPIKVLESSEFFKRTPISASKSIADRKIGIIAEHKRKSPSKGVINDSLSVEFVTQGYAQAGAACISVLTDAPFFGGSLTDLKAARIANPHTPLLRKDFIVDEYQILEAKAFGADVILLIAANLEVSQCSQLAAFAQRLGLETLLEVHDETELKMYLNPYINLVGVNNRNLKSFEVSLDTSKRLAPLIPNNYIKVAESGLNTADDIATLYKAGYKGFLIGESFMKTHNPGEACKNLLQKSLELMG